MADYEEVGGNEGRLRRVSMGPPAWMRNPIMRIPLIIGGLIAMVAGYVWFVQRVDVGPDEVLILVRRIGAPLPAGKADDQVVLYPGLLKELGEEPGSTKYQGIVYEPKQAGWHFYDPFLWDRIVRKREEIKNGEIGIKIRKYGKPLPPGKTVATEPDERGPLAQVLEPGVHPINPFAYEIKRVKPVVIPAGFVGVQTLLAGPEPAEANRYIVLKGERGVQPDVVFPGTDFNNPYVRRLDLIDIRSHSIDLLHDNEIRFPSNDSFMIVVDVSIEYAIRPDKAPYVMVAIGDHEDVKSKLIRPAVSSLCRIEGSKMLAREFISGDSRTTLQQRLLDGLRQHCYEQGIDIRSANVRRIVPPEEIAGPISDRQLADQQTKQYMSEIKVAESEAKLVEQQEMQKQNQAIGQASRAVVSVVKEAEQDRAVAVLEANQRLEVAKLSLEAARQKALAIIARGEAEAEVMRLEFEAETKPLREAIGAFGSGDEYAQYFFYQKLGPALKSVLASTDGPFADIFKALSAPGPISAGKSGEKRSEGKTVEGGGAAVAHPSDSEGGQR